MKKLLTVVLILLIIILAVAGAGVYGAYRVSQLDVNYPNLSVNGIAVGGLTKAQTAEALNAGGWEARVSTPLTVTTLAGQSFTVDPLQSGVLQTAEGIADMAYAYGRQGNLIENFISYLRCRFRPTELEHPEQNADRTYLSSLIAQNQADIDALLGDAEYVPDYEGETLRLMKGQGQLRLDEEGLTEAIIAALQAGEHTLSFDRLSAELTMPDFDAIHTELLKEPKDAAFTDDGKFDVIDEVVGCRFDVEQAKALWEAAAPAEEVDVPMSVSWPAVTGRQLRDSLFHDLLGECVTNYWNSTDNRINNVKLASSKIDGTILYPGDVFSYNEVVGQRTQEAGFLPAPAYVDGDVKDEIGGGACQVSSTLYCATLFAFLETVERTNHYFPVHYMQLGTDATVTIPDEGGNVMDLKFKNNRNYPIKIVAYSTVDEENYFRDLHFEIWGTLEDDDYMPIQFDNRNPWGWEFSNHLWDVEPAYPDRPGYRIKLEHETYYFSDDTGEGARTLTYRKVFTEDGEQVFEELLNPLLPSGGAAMDTYYDHN